MFKHACFFLWLDKCVARWECRPWWLAHLKESAASDCWCWVLQVGITYLPRDPLSLICSSQVSLARDCAWNRADVIHGNPKLIRNSGRYGSWLGPLRLTCKELRAAADLLVTRLFLNAANITEEELRRQLQVLLAVFSFGPALVFPNAHEFYVV